MSDHPNIDRFREGVEAVRDADPLRATVDFPTAAGALVEIEALVERAEAAEAKLSTLLCDLTGGLLSKPTYDVRTHGRGSEDGSRTARWRLQRPGRDRAADPQHRRRRADPPHARRGGWRMRPLDSILDLLDVLRRYVWDAAFALVLLACLATLALMAYVTVVQPWR